ncbi:L-2-hydroxyglutarate oxidase [Alteromonadaceae bacterium M269]|nr:L-2-hydroxyglutarate oxidase [Alteromonadaceae bacterium M269]
MSTTFDFILIGGGVVGASTAWQLQKRYPEKRILLLEKETHCAMHQTGRNSGVIHAGVYYQPGSLKASFCRQGLEQTVEFCRQYNLPFEQCGKLLVATNDVELERMTELYDRCQLNDLEPELLDEQQLLKAEPNIVGKGAILVRKTGITHYRAITETLLKLFTDLNGTVHFSSEVMSLHENENTVDVVTESDTYKASFVINCAGLMSDRLIAQAGIEMDFMIIPFRGEYYQLPESFNQVVNRLIYPIPDPALPFLGVHLTKMIDGSVTVGPNAVLAFKREGYSKTSVNYSDIREMLSFNGFKYLIKNHWRSGLKEFRNSTLKSGYLKEVQKYCPKVGLDDLRPYPSGVRAQAVDLHGNLIHDFKFVETPNSLHVGNAPSPAATSALPIGHYILDKVEQLLN